jgi:hypothetical protein
MTLPAHEKQAVIDQVADLQLFIPDHCKLIENLLVPIAIGAVEFGKRSLFAATQTVNRPSIDKLRGIARTMAAGTEAQEMLDLFERQKKDLENTETGLKNVMDGTELDRDDAKEKIAIIQKQLLRECQRFCRELFNSFRQVRVEDEVDEVVRKYPVLEMYLDDDLGDERKFMDVLRTWSKMNP